MNWRAIITRARDESGTAMVEFAIIAALFFLIMFAALDFGRLLYTVVHAEKAAQIAARIATTRPIACLAAGSALPINTRPVGATTLARSGTSCDVAGDVCRSVSYSCGSIDLTGQPSFHGPNLVHSVLSPTHPTVVAIWNEIAPLMPPGTDSTVLNFRYDYDPALGFLGGPYTPIVTVQFDLPPFAFVSPVGGLVALASGGASPAFAGDLNYPSFSVSIPAEDLRAGEGG
jgi:Flp pilus assembly pilin Flp